MADRHPFDRPDAPHPVHDLLLVAAFAAGDLEGGELARASALVDACAECRTLVSDLRAISRATAALPAPPSPRDFFVSHADAERLRPHGLRRLVAAIAGPRVQLARPIAGGLMMLGFAGLLVAALPSVSQLGTSSAADQRLELLASPVPGSETQGQPQAPAPSGPSATDAEFGDVRGGAGQGASPLPVAGGPASASAAAVDPDALRASREPGRDAVAGPSALAIGSVALVAIGAALFLASLRRPGPRRS